MIHRTKVFARKIKHNQRKITKMKFETNAEAGTITFRGGVGDFENHIGSNDFMDALSDHAGGDVTIHLDSEGGSVVDGISIYNQIRNYPGKVTVHIDSLAASIATVISSAADHVIINSTGRMMVHSAWTVAMGNAKDFRGMVNILEQMDRDIASVYAARSEKSEDEWLEIMAAETWYTAEDALAAGLVDEVNEIKPTKKAPAAAKAEANVSSIGPVWKAKIEATARRIRLKSRSN